MSCVVKGSPQYGPKRDGLKGMASTMTREEVREHFAGPVASVKTCFHQDGSLDLTGTRSLVDFVIAGGAKTIIITPGDSLCMLSANRKSDN